MGQIIGLPRDEKVKASSTDTNPPNYLWDKLDAGAGITLTNLGTSVEISSSGGTNPVKFAGVVDVRVSPICEGVAEPTSICCPSFESDDVIICTPKICSPESAICDYIFWHACMVEVESGWCAYIWVYSNDDKLKEMYVTVTDAYDCRG